LDHFLKGEHEKKLETNGKKNFGIEKYGTSHQLKIVGA
jgi:hypothetical protein